MTDERYNPDITVCGDLLVEGVHHKKATHIGVDPAGTLIRSVSWPGVDHLIKLGANLVGVSKTELVCIDTAIYLRDQRCARLG